MATSYGPFTFFFISKTYAQFCPTGEVMIIRCSLHQGHRIGSGQSPFSMLKSEPEEKL